MKLIVKFNLALSILFLLGLGVSGYVSYNILQRNAREEILQNARIMMQGALAIRGYTSAQIKPLLENQLKYEFLPQAVSAYSANAYFAELRKQYPEYAYKEATLNPTNLSDRAADWEADIVNNFRQAAADNAPKEVVGDRETPTGRSLYLARPLRIADARCLVCHSTAEAAPASMIEKYGNANGFGWKFQEVVGAQIVSVPMDVAIARADHTFKIFMGLLLAIGVFMFLLLNVMLITLVVRPVNKLASLADKVSLGDMDAEEFTTSGRDEIATLAGAFSRMRTSLVHALKLLES